MEAAGVQSDQACPFSPKEPQIRHGKKEASPAVRAAAGSNRLKGHAVETVVQGQGYQGLYLVQGNSVDRRVKLQRTRRHRARVCIELKTRA